MRDHLINSETSVEVLDCSGRWSFYI